VVCRARHERFRESEALRRVFEGVVAKWIVAGLVGGRGVWYLIKAADDKKKRVPGDQPIGRGGIPCARPIARKARGFFAQPVPSFGIRSLLRSTLTRRRSAALPVQEGRSLMNSRTQAAIGSASMMPSIAALRLAA
jgi:hypothetical protein